MPSDPATQKLYRRITLRITPFLFVCYLIAMVDRTNVGFAKLQFMADLHLSETQFGISASLLYLGYVLFDIPSNLMTQRSGLGVTLLRIMVLWGIVTMILAFAGSAPQFYLLRFLIGVGEAGFLPGVLLYLTYWFPEHMRGRMTSWFVTGMPVSGILGGPLAGWIMSSTQGLSGLNGWQWLFVIEGIPAVLLGIAAYFWLARTPAEAAWLSDEERRLVAREIESAWPAEAEQPHSFRAALADKRVWGFTIGYFLFYCVLNAVLTWIPTLLRSVGHLTIGEIGWLSGGISVVSAIGMRLISLSSDRRGERRWHVIGCGLVSGLSLLLLSFGAGSVILTALILMAASTTVFTFMALFWTIPSAYLRGSAAAGGLAMISSIGATGGVVSPIFIGWLKDLTGSYYGSLGAMGLLEIVGMAVLYLSLRRPDAPETALLGQAAN